MSTPRKSRHRHHPSNNSRPRQVAASDYESDAAHYMENREASTAADPPPARDNTELSLWVLRRYRPSIRSILAIAANAVAYSFQESTQAWEKHGVEGTMFVCDQEPAVAPDGRALPSVCVFILNRRSMDNLVVDLLRVTDCEVVGELIVFRLEADNDAANNNWEGAGGGERKVFGLWIHSDEANTRELHSNLILATWKECRAALESCTQGATAPDDDDGVAATSQQTDAATASGSAAGRRLSITDLFGQKNGG